MQLKTPEGAKAAVVYWEYERGWGSKVDHTQYFDDLNEASEVTKRFNAQNTETVVPDWYMVAELKVL